MSDLPRVLVLNGSLRGADGNTGWLLAEAGRRLEGRAEVDTLDLVDATPDLDEVVERLRAARALLVGTGVYWHSWGSPLQRFLEVLTPFENTGCFFAKPVGVLVTMDSVGGAELCARLQGVFNQFGCVVPPCTSLVLGRLAMEARASTDEGEHDPNHDIWQLEDLDVVLENLLEATRVPAGAFRSWPFRPLIAPKGAWPATGRLDLGSPRFLPPR